VSDTGARVGVRVGIGALVMALVGVLGFSALMINDDPSPRRYTVYVTWEPQPRDPPILVNTEINGVDVLPPPPGGLAGSTGVYTHTYDGRADDVVRVTVWQPRGTVPGRIACRIIGTPSPTVAPVYDSAERTTDQASEIDCWMNHRFWHRVNPRHPGNP